MFGCRSDASTRNSETRTSGARSAGAPRSGAGVSLARSTALVLSATSRPFRRSRARKTLPAAPLGRSRRRGRSAAPATDSSARRQLASVWHYAAVVWICASIPAISTERTAAAGLGCGSVPHCGKPSCLSRARSASSSSRLRRHGCAGFARTFESSEVQRIAFARSRAGVGGEPESDQRSTHHAPTASPCWFSVGGRVRTATPGSLSERPSR